MSWPIISSPCVPVAMRRGRQIRRQGRIGSVWMLHRSSMGRATLATVVNVLSKMTLSFSGVKPFKGCGMNRQPPVISNLIQRGDGRIRRCTRYRRHRPFLRYDANTNTVFLQVNEAKFHLLRG